MIPEWRMQANWTLSKSGRVPEAGEKCRHCDPDLRGNSCHQAMSRHRSLLLTPSWEPKQLCSNKGHITWSQFPWESGIPLRVGRDPPQTVATSHRSPCSRHSPNTPTVVSIPLSPPNPIEKVSPNKPLLSAPLVWTDTRGWATSRGGSKTKVEQQGPCEQGRGRECAPAAAGAADQISHS